MSKYSRKSFGRRKVNSGIPITNKTLKLFFGSSFGMWDLLLVLLVVGGLLFFVIEGRLESNIIQNRAFFDFVDVDDPASSIVYEAAPAIVQYKVGVLGMVDNLLQIVLFGVLGFAVMRFVSGKTGGRFS